MASKSKSNELSEVGKRWSRAHAIVAAVDAAARENDKLDERDRRNLSQVANEIALLAVGLAQPEARGLVARMMRGRKGKDVLSARMLALVEDAMRNPNYAQGAETLVALFSTQVDKLYRKLEVAAVEQLLQSRGRKGAPALTAAITKLTGEAANEKQIAKNLDKSRAALRNRDDKKPSKRA